VDFTLFFFFGFAAAKQPSDSLLEFAMSTIFGLISSRWAPHKVCGACGRSMLLFSEFHFSGPWSEVDVLHLSTQEANRQKTVFLF
jgi:hypothetical protein